MCGIIGYVGGKVADRVLMDGLKRLEYRGYDSAGIAVLQNKQLVVHRSVGKLVNLEQVLAEEALNSRIGLGHTRWATHGKPTEANAHPHMSNNYKIAIVHNGIIENYADIKAQLEKKYEFRSETDTEVLAHLIEDCYEKFKDKKDPLLVAVQEAMKKVKGSYALAAICLDDIDKIVIARQHSPLMVGAGDNEFFVASDITAFLSYTNRVIEIEDGETGYITKNEFKIYDSKGNEIKRKISTIDWDPVVAEKGGYKHFMLKEIFEQPGVVSDTIRGRINLYKKDVFLEDVKLTQKDINSIKRIVIIACGTSYHAGLIGKFLIEDLAKIPCEVDIGSEFRYRNHILDDTCLVVGISQSGETADTLASFISAKEKKVKDLVICNVIGSSLARKASNIIYTRCGPEIGVASTKAFTGQLCALYLLALYLGKRTGVIDDKYMKKILNELLKIPGLIEETLDKTKDIMKSWAKIFFKKRSFLYLGRNINYPIALEGALKLKEISYIHAEGYPAGEMKHGPIALIDENMPVLSIVTKSSVYDKIASNVEEARSREGKMLAIASDGNQEIKNKVDYVCYVPHTMEILSPMINIIPLQFLAYFIAKIRGCDVDQPRNLAKSVTVE